MLRLWLKTLLLVVVSGCAGDPRSGTSASPPRPPADAASAEAPDTGLEAADAGPPTDGHVPAAATEQPASDASTAVEASDAADTGAGDVRPTPQMDEVEHHGGAIALDPRMRGVWYFGWMGGNFSFVQLALCDDGTLSYRYAQAPDDPEALLAQATVVVLTPTRLRFRVDESDPRFASAPALHGELEFDAEQDRLSRTNLGDGYESSGVRWSEIGWAEATSPTPSCP